MSALLPSASKKPIKYPINKWLICFMLLTIALTVWTAFNDDEKKEVDLVSDRPIQKQSVQQTLDATNVITTKANTTTGLANDTLIPWQHLTRKPQLAKPSNLFKVHSWVVVPAKVKQKPQPAPPPVAPAAPFIYFGKLEDSPSNMQIFLVANNRLYSTKLGEKIDQLWRLDAEDANVLRLTYLPLNLPQVISKSARPAIVPTEILPVAENNQ